MNPIIVPLSDDPRVRLGQFLRQRDIRAARVRCLAQLIAQPPLPELWAIGQGKDAAAHLISELPSIRFFRSPESYANRSSRTRAGSIGDSSGYFVADREERLQRLRPVDADVAVFRCLGMPEPSWEPQKPRTLEP